MCGYARSEKANQVEHATQGGGRSHAERLRPMEFGGYFVCLVDQTRGHRKHEASNLPAVSNGQIEGAVGSC